MTVKRPVDVHGKVAATLSQDEWKGVQRVLPKDQLKDNTDYRRCARELGKVFVKQLCSSASAAEPQGTPLVIAKLEGDRLRALPGLRPIPDPSRGLVFPQGFHCRLGLSLASGYESLVVRRIRVAVQTFGDIKKSQYAYKLDASETPGLGFAPVGVFQVSVHPGGRTTGYWGVKGEVGDPIRDATNLLETDHPHSINLTSVDQQQELEGDILAAEPGLYRISFSFSYNARGRDYETPSDDAVWVYKKRE